MNNIKEVTNNPLVWVLLLLLLQVGITFKLDSVTNSPPDILPVIEKIESEQAVNTNIINIVKTQHEVIVSRDGTIDALVSFQRTIGGFCAIILAGHIFLSIRRKRVE